MKKLLYHLRIILFLTTFYLKHPSQITKHFQVFKKTKKINISALNIDQEHTQKVSILIITYGALDYVRKCLVSLEKFRPQNSEVVVFDNGSDHETKAYLKLQLGNKVIHKLKFSDTNFFFVKGNNEAAKLVSEDSKYLLLLNSDTEIKDSRWLDVLLSIHPRRGISSLGAVTIPVPRPDGWCFLVDKKTFNELGGLDETFQMNWGITEFTARVLAAGYKVNTVSNPDNLIVHYGGKSYKKKQKTDNYKSLSFNEVFEMFGNKRVNWIKIK